jgi:hypothetical protein
MSAHRLCLAFDLAIKSSGLSTTTNEGLVIKITVLAIHRGMATILMAGLRPESTKILLGHRLNQNILERIYDASLRQVDISNSVADDFSTWSPSSKPEFDMP